MNMVENLGDKNSNRNLKLYQMQGKGDFRELRTINVHPKRVTNIVFDKKITNCIIQTNQNRVNGPLQLDTTDDEKKAICAESDMKLSRKTTDIKLMKHPECSKRIELLNTACTINENINNLDRRILLPIIKRLFESAIKVFPNLDQIDGDMNKGESYYGENQETKNPLNTTKVDIKNKASLLGCNRLKLKSIFSLFQSGYSNKKNKVIEGGYVNNNNCDTPKVIMNAKNSDTEITSTHKLNEETCLIIPENTPSYVLNDLTQSDMKIDEDRSNNISVLSDRRNVFANFDREYKCHYVYVNMDPVKPDSNTRKVNKLHSLQNRCADKVDTNSKAKNYSNNKCSIGKLDATSKRQPYFVVNAVPKSYYKFVKDNNSKLKTINNPEKTLRDIKKDNSNKKNLICRNKTSKTSCASKNSKLPSQNNECNELTGASIKKFLASIKSNFIVKVTNRFRNIFQNVKTKEHEDVVLQCTTKSETSDKPLFEIQIDPITKRILNVCEVKRKLKPLKKQHKGARDMLTCKSRYIDRYTIKSKVGNKKCLEHELTLSPSSCKGPMFEVKLDCNNMQILNFPEVMQKIRNLNCRSIMKSGSKCSDRKSIENQYIGLKKTNSKGLRDVKSKISCLWTRFTCRYDVNSKHYNIRSGTTIPKKKVTSWQLKKCKKDKKTPKSFYKNCKKSTKTKKQCKKNLLRNQCSTLRKRHFKRQANRTNGALQFFKNTLTCGFNKKTYSCSSQNSRTSNIKRESNKRTTAKKKKKVLVCGKRKVRHKRHDQILYHCQYGHLRDSKKSCLWLYIVFPSMYRACLTMKKIARFFVRYLQIIMALAFWLPCIIVLEILHACCCL